MYFLNIFVFGYDRTELLETLLDHSTSAYLRYERRLTYDKKEEFEALQKKVNEENYKNGYDGFHIRIVI